MIVWLASRFFCLLFANEFWNLLLIIRNVFSHCATVDGAEKAIREHKVIAKYTKLDFSDRGDTGAIKLKKLISANHYRTTQKDISKGFAGCNKILIYCNW